MKPDIISRNRKARKLQPVLCLQDEKVSIWGMRSDTDNAVNYQVKIIRPKKSSKKPFYKATCYKVISPGVEPCLDCEKNRVVCKHIQAAILAMAKAAGKKVKFRTSLKNAILRKKIEGGVVIEIWSKGNSIFGVVK